MLPTGKTECVAAQELGRPISKAPSIVAEKCSLLFLGSTRWILRGPPYPKSHCAPVMITLEEAMADTQEVLGFKYLEQHRFKCLTHRALKPQRVQSYVTSVDVASS